MARLYLFAGIAGALVMALFGGCSDDGDAMPESVFDSDSRDVEAIESDTGNDIETQPLASDDGDPTDSDPMTDDSASQSGSDSGSDTESQATTDTWPEDTQSASQSATQVDSDSQSGSESEGGCGNGVLEPYLGEVCDDGNDDGGDGCSASCEAVETGFACPMPGHDCVSTVVCGDGKVSGSETCDDGNNKDSDGCSSACTLELGYVCPEPGKRCEATQCGDGVVAGREECDDRNGDGGDGCSAQCKLEQGWACSAPGEACHPAVCNDGVKEGFEPCDDGNLVVGDGCTPFCEVEPLCNGGPCHSACGDGMMLPGDAEQCDDGNTKNGDGCSSSCQIEPGFACDSTSNELPAVLEVPVTFRDFIGLPAGSSVRHPDFQHFGGSAETPGLVQSQLDADGKPAYTGICQEGAIVGPCPYGAQTTSAEAFAQWYRDVPGVNLTKVVRLSLASQGDGSYFYPESAFFPWDGDGFTAAGLELTSDGHNFSFTSEVRYWFEFKGGESLAFSGDDDVWVFVNDRLALDLGGLHPKRSGSFVLDDAKAGSLGLEVGKVYEIALFHAERHTHASNFNLTLAGFTKVSSHCQTLCGDGIVAGDEVCDDGVNDGSYGGCLPQCVGRGPRCGDGHVDSADGEVCDDGVNLSLYNEGGEPGCAPGCVLGSYCGDGSVDSLFGEECDDGINDGSYGGCTESCRLASRCGDGHIDADHGEVCDDGNNVWGDGCSGLCKSEAPT